MSSKRRRSLKIVLFLGLQVLVTLALAEMAIRTLSRFNENIRQLSYNQSLAGRYKKTASLEELLTSTQRGFKPLAVVGGFRTNSMGLRTREYSVEKDSASYRIVALGDSFTFASGLTPFPLHWPALMESRMRRELAVPAEAINLGYPGIGPLFELRMWQLEGSRLSPDLVVLAFYVGNDFLDGQAPMTVDDPIDALAQNSYLVRVGRNLYRYKEAEETVAASLGETTQPEAPVQVSDVGGVELYGYDRLYDGNKATMPVRPYERLIARQMSAVHSPNKERFDLESERVSRVVGEIRASVERSGAKFLMMIIPSEYQIDPEVAARGAEFSSNRLADYDLDRPQRLLMAFCKEIGMECLDLLPASRHVAGSQRIYRRRNTHWNVEGNALAVDALMHWARQNVDPQPFADVEFEVEPIYDLDNDGVANRDDACPDTVIPETPPTRARRRPHFALTDYDLEFDETSGRSELSYTTRDTRGCSCEQILHIRKQWDQHGDSGCPENVLRRWVARFEAL